MTRSIALFLPHRVQLSSVSGPTDLLQMANQFAGERTGGAGSVRTRDPGAHVACHWLSIDGRPVRSACGGSVTVDGSIARTDDYDAVVLGAFDEHGDGTLTDYLERHASLRDWLRHQHAAGAVVATCSNGVFFLAEAGLLDGCPASVPWWYQRLFHHRYPAVRIRVSHHIVEHERTICVDSLAGIFPVTLRMIRSLTSPNTVDWLSKTALISGERGIAEPDDGMLAPPDTVGDPLVAAAQYHLQQRYAEEGVIEALARMLSVSSRTLGRHFKSALGMPPQRYVQHLRLEAAKRMLRRTSLRIDRIAQQVGYQDARHFKRVFRSRFGVTPAAWRETESGADPSSGQERGT